VAENTGVQSTMAVSSLKNADDTTVHAKIFLLGHANNVGGEPGIELSGHFFGLAVQIRVLPFTRIEAS
jgi:hypothetical protein